MLLHPFTAEHLDSAGKIALAQWGWEVPEIPESLRPRIYEYLVRYYFVPDSPYSFGISEENGRLLGMLLAAPVGKTGAESAGKWIGGRLAAQEKAVFEMYRNYLDGNMKKEHASARPGEISLLLFASVRHGCGRLLLNEFERVCLRDGIPSMILWTDDTCDCSYYPAHGFESAGTHPTDPPLAGKSLRTLLFRKRFRA